MSEHPEYERTDPDLEPQPGEDNEVEAPSTADPDLEAARAQAPAQDPKTLTTDQLQPEEELTEYEPPFEPTPETAEGVTAEDERDGETLDQRLRQEEPDVPRGPDEIPDPEQTEDAIGQPVEADVSEASDGTL
jgi:hypothetical protein